MTPIVLDIENEIHELTDLGFGPFFEEQIQEDDAVVGRIAAEHSGGLVIDTPGMRELQLFDDEGLDRVFSDVEAFTRRCRFRDCTHHGEPGCAVREAVAAGTLAENRVAHYLELGAEGQASERRRDNRRHREAERAFSKRIGRDTKIIQRWKEGQIG